MCNVLQLFFTLLIICNVPVRCHFKEQDRLTKLQNCFAQKKILACSFVTKSNNSTRYDELNQSYQLKPPATAPLGFVLVRNEADVIGTVICSKDLGIRVAPKGGGHSLEKYSFGDRDSVVIDLRALDDVKVNRDEGTAIIGPGNLMAPLTWKLWSMAKVVVPITQCPTVGVTASLGGGYGVFTGLYGMNLDQIVEMRVVLANGDVVVANHLKNPDLYWALRGAGATSFGIVTQFVFKTFPAPQRIFEGILNFHISQLAKVLNVWQNLLLTDTRPNSVTSQINYDLSKYFFVFTFTDVSGSASKFRKILQLLPPPHNMTTTKRKFIDYIVSSVNTTTLLTPTSIGNLKTPSDLLNLDQSSNPIFYDKSKSFFVQKIVGTKILSKLQKFVKDKPEQVYILFESYGGAVRSIGVNETAFIHRDSLYVVSAIYSNDLPNATTNAIGHAFVKRFFKLGKTLFDHKETYQNYCEADLPNYLKRYYGNSLPRLVQVKRNYDPGNFFKFPQSIPTSLKKHFGKKEV